MTLQEFLRILRSAEAQERLQSEIRELQTRIALELTRQLVTLGIQDKAFEASPTNITRSTLFVEQVKGLLQEQRWRQAVQRYLDSFDGLQQAVIQYGGTQGDVSATVLDAIRIQYKQTTERYLINPDTFNDRLWSPLVDQMVASIASGSPVNNTLETIQDLIAPKDADGPLERTVRAATENAEVIYKRASLKAAADDIGAEFFLYQGRNIDTTRPFCKERAGHAWHRVEVEQWGRQAASGRLHWAGMTDGTNADTIFIYVGGYYGTERSCRHVLVPVPRRDIPREDWQRMVDKGLVQQADTRA